MTKEVTLLPQGSTPWEIAESLVSAKRRPLDASIIRKLWNPWECPEEYLPILAWGLGLEIWNDNWPLSKKREIVARIWQLKRLKTTPEGIRQYMGLVDSEPVKFRRPKDKMWWIPSLTPEELAALMAKMPEIRIYYAENTPYGWRATYVEDGVETDVFISGFQNAVVPTHIVSIAGRGLLKSFYNTQRGWPQFRNPSDAADNMVTIQPTHGGLSFAVAPGLAPIQVSPKYVSDKVTAPVYKSWHYPSFQNYAFYIPSDARKHMYQSFRFLRPDRIGRFGTPMSFWKWSKSGMPLFTATVSARVPTKLPDYAFRRWWHVGFWNPSDVSRLWETLDAIKAAQAARDEVWVALGRYEPLLFSDTLWFNEFNFGDYKEVW